MKKYYAWADRIEQREIVRETPNSVFLECHEPWANGARREAKITETSGYFDTWEEARHFLLESEEGKIAALGRELARRQERIEKITRMVE